MKAEAIITDIQRFSVHDGPGIRTVVFVKGCPLKCAWCQNPETQSAFPELMVDSRLCIGCGSCILACEHDAVAGSRKNCIGCGKCTEKCYAKSRKLVGKKRTVVEIFEKVIRDEIFFKNSGGGLTISGGEATLYKDFCCALFERFKERGLSTALETTGYCRFDVLESIAHYCDLFLYDIKTMDPEIHKLYTGVGNQIILENIKRLKEIGADVIIRYPFIPGVNDTEKNIRAVGELARSIGVRQIHLLPFHQFGASKWDELDKNYGFLNHEIPLEEDLERARVLLADYISYVNIGGNGEKEEDSNDPC